MNINFVLGAIFLVLALTLLYLFYRAIKRTSTIEDTLSSLKNSMTTYTLKNGAKVVLLKDSKRPKVFVSTVWNVGSAHETDTTRGMAHLLEHMSFKGTDKMSEADLRQIGTIFGAEHNAFTAPDKTIYYFHVNKGDWKPFLEILADCAQNIRCGEEQLASELQVVVQELKMRRDNIAMVTLDQTLKNMFPENHPYHNTPIGYVPTLAAVKAQDVHEFYKKHYTMDNLSIVVVGDFEEQEVIRTIEENFGKYSSKQKSEPILFPQISDQCVSQTETVLYHEIAQPCVTLAWQAPGLKDLMALQTGSILASIMGSNFEGSLRRILVDELKLADAVGVASSQEHNEIGIFQISFSCKKENIEDCINTINQYLRRLPEDGINQKYLNAIKLLTKNSLPGLLSSYATIGLSIVSRCTIDSQNPGALFDTCKLLDQISAQDVKKFAQKYLSCPFATKISLMPVDDQSRSAFVAALEEQTRLEQEILKNHVRTAPLEQPKLALLLQQQRTTERKDFPIASFPKPTDTFILENGLKVVALNRADQSGIINCCLAPKDLEWRNGSLNSTTVCSIANTLILENAQKSQLVKPFQDLGAVLSINHLAANLSATPDKFFQAFDKMIDLVSCPNFTQEDLDKFLPNCLANYSFYSKNQQQLLLRGVNAALLNGTALDWNFDQASQVCKDITLDQIKNAHEEFFCPSNLVLIISGQLPQGWENVVKEKLGKLSTPSKPIPPKETPEIKVYQATKIKYLLASNQTLIALVRPNRLKASDIQRNAINLLTSIILSGQQGSDLFSLRETSGMFYAAGGQFASGATSNYSIDQITAIVDAGNVDKFTTLVMEMLSKRGQEGITADQLESAKQKLLITTSVQSASNAFMQTMFLSAEISGLDYDFGNKGIEYIKDLSLEEINALVREYCTADGWSIIEVGQ